ncbi:MAG: SIS domain-containing protein [Parvularculaceae bacterium]|nr:MAG: SIS domain-containing protein [Parvularculaceae bacterium]
MSLKPTLMHQEVREIPQAVERLLSDGNDAIRTAVALMRAANPRYFISVARGSSDHAATFLKYASELLLGRPMASVGPSVSSVYGVTLDARDAVGISVSQSGKSPDIVAMTRALRLSGALTVAITNDAASRLGRAADVTLPIHAGPELSVAATKTFVTSLIAGLWLFAELSEDDELLRAIRTLPEFLEQATYCDWSAAAAAIDGRSLYTIGRGPSWAISNEAALKFKETCLIHAESYSSAEVLHGPVSIVESGFPVIVFAACDKAEQTAADTADALAEKGANVFAVTNKTRRATPLPHVRTDHWLCDPIAAIVSFYTMVEEVARAQGINPDQPRHLKKVTETV